MVRIKTNNNIQETYKIPITIEKEQHSNLLHIFIGDIASIWATSSKREPHNFLDFYYGNILVADINMNIAEIINGSEYLSD